MNRRFALKSLAAGALMLSVGACANQGPDIVQIANSDPNFSTLAAAIEAANLEDTLRSPGPLTVFAPTNAAFDALPAGTVETLLQPQNQPQLADILRYHVLNGAVTSDQILGENLEVETAEGSFLNVNGSDGETVRVGNGSVTTADIKASNGVIHVIDTVLLP